MSDEVLLRQLRREIHANPELSGREVATARRLQEFLEPLGPQRIHTDVGGPGLIVLFEGRDAGPTVVVRSELDALPIEERGNVAHRSRVPGVAHLCGHDGHMVMLAGVARKLTQNPLEVGRVALLFQPAEETGAGALAMLEDRRVRELEPDLLVSLHNMPGFPLGSVLVREGPFCCASRGVELQFVGRSAHAAQPETGVSPLAAIVELTAWLEETCRDASGKQMREYDGETLFATVVGARVGQAAYGTFPGDGELHVTLRAATDATLERFWQGLKQRAAQCARDHALELILRQHDDFAATTNDAAATDRVRAAAGDAAFEIVELDRPNRWSEDFGRFGRLGPTVMFGLGAGLDQPALHNPDYDFPDALLLPGVEMFERIVRSRIREL